MRIVLDCSTVMAWCFEDECDRHADAVLNALDEHSGFAPTIWPFEVANVLLAAERQRRLSASDTARFVELLAGLPIEIEPANPNLILTATLATGRTYGLSSYDAAYLELAMRTAAPLATRDKRLRAACRKAGVRLFR